MATLLTAILCLLLRNCTKRIEQDFLHTDSLQLKIFTATYGKFSKILISYIEKYLIYTCNVINKIYCRNHGARSNCYICNYC